MRGPDLLLAHLALLSDPEEESGAVDRPSARERLEAELGPELAQQLLELLVRPRGSGTPS